MNTKIINISIQSSLLQIIERTSFKMFPKHNGIDTISEYLALNLIVPVPLTNK